MSRNMEPTSKMQLINNETSLYILFVELYKIYCL